MDIVVHHNPDCRNLSRVVLAVITAAGYTPTIIEYLRPGRTRPQLLALLQLPGSHRSALRERNRRPPSPAGCLSRASATRAFLG